jgi:hypothetical protein
MSSKGIGSSPDRECIGAFKGNGDTAMPEVHSCPHCGNPYWLAAGRSEMEVTCPSCQRSFMPPLVDYMIRESSKQPECQSTSGFLKFVNAVGGDHGFMITGALSGLLGGILAGVVVSGWEHSLPRSHPELPPWWPVPQESSTAFGGVVGGIIGGLLAGFALGVVIGALVGMNRRSIEHVLELTTGRVAVISGGLSGVMTSFFMGSYRWTPLGLILGCLGAFFWLLTVIWAESHVPGIIESMPLGNKQITEDDELPVKAQQISPK